MQRTRFPYFVQVDQYSTVEIYFDLFFQPFICWWLLRLSPSLGGCECPTANTGRQVLFPLNAHTHWELGHRAGLMVLKNLHAVSFQHSYTNFYPYQQCSMAPFLYILSSRGCLFDPSYSNTIGLFREHETLYSEVILDIGFLLLLCVFTL